MNIPYQPLRRNRTAIRNWPILTGLSGKYKKTQNQIVLNWLKWKGFKPLVKSESKSHIDENLAAFDFVMEKADYISIDKFRVPNYKTPDIDWWQEGTGDEKIHMLPNVFDERYPAEK